MQFMIISRIKTFLNYQQVDYWDILFFTNMCYFFLFFFTIFARLSCFERRKKDNEIYRQNVSANR